MTENKITFDSVIAAHEHSLETLSELEKYTDFMRSIDSMHDIGCGTGLDLEWWATRTYEDDNERSVPLNIKCTGIDLLEKMSIAQQHTNVTYERRNFEDRSHKCELTDVIWCHNTFQYAVNPLQTLSYFYDMLTPGGMLALTVPQTTNVVYHKEEYDQIDGQYFNYTLVSLIHMLAVSGFDCNAGFFKKNFNDPWLNAVVYKSDHKPMDPRTTKWRDLAEKELLPGSAVNSINQCGHVRQRDLVLHWLDKSNRAYG